MKNDYYVYAYLDAETGCVYYIGEGRDKRAYSKQHRVPIPNDTRYIVFLERNLTNTGALALERRYIRWYGRADKNEGTLLNKTNGGDGIDSSTAALWVHKAKESGNFYTGMASTMKKRTTETRTLDGLKAHNTRVSRNIPYSTDSSVAKMVETRKNNGSYTNSLESIEKMKQTRIEKGLNEIASKVMKQRVSRDEVLKVKQLKQDLDVYIKERTKIPKIAHNSSSTRQQELLNAAALNLSTFFGMEISVSTPKDLLVKRDQLRKITTLSKNWHTFNDQLLNKEYYKLCTIAHFLYTVNSTIDMPASLIAAAQIGQGAANPTLSDLVTLAI